MNTPTMHSPVMHSQIAPESRRRAVLRGIFAPPAVGWAARRQLARLGRALLLAALFLPGAAAAQHVFTLTGPATITETDADANTRYTLTRTGPAIMGSDILSIRATVVSGTATAADFSGGTLPISQATYTGSATVERFDIGIAGDSLPEGDETFTITFSIIPGSQLAVTRNGGVTLPADFTVTILANDGYTASTLAIAADDPNTTEGDTAVFTVTLTAGNPAPTYPVTVDWAVGGDVDSADVDATGGTLSFTAAGSQTINIGIAEDLSAEAAEDLTVTLSNPSSGAIFANAADVAATTAIAASTLARRLTLSGPATAEEGADATYEVTLAGTPFASPTAVTWTVTHTDTAAADFAAVTGSIMYPTMTSFSIGILDDDATEATATEPAEAFSVQISTAAGTGVNAIGAAVATTIGPDAAHVITIDDTTTTVTEGAPTITVTRTASIDLVRPVDIMWAITHGTTIAADFTGAPGSLTGSVRFSGSQTEAIINLPVADDRLSEMAETFTLTLSESLDAATQTANSEVAAADTATVTITDNDAISASSMTLRGPATLNEERSAVFTVDLGAVVTGSDVTVMIAADAASTATLTTDYTLSATSLTIAVDARSATFTVTTTDGGGDDTEDRTLTLTLTATGGANTLDMDDMAGMATRTFPAITISEDDPAAREARLEAPLASAGRGVGQLASAAVVGRLRAAGAGGGAGNSLSIAGRELMQSRGLETLTADFLAAGYATGAAEFSVEELLRTSSFNLTGGGARGFNFWGSGGSVSADGDHDGVDYDGDTSAFHLGLDTAWGDGLVGVAVGRSAGDVDFTVKADGSKSTLETSVTSAHPYLSRRVGRAQVWATAGHGSGDAELKEDGATFKTDITVTTAAIGITRAQDAQLNAGLSALYTRAELDAATAAGKTLRATTADSMRVTANAQARWTHGQMSPFLDVGLRHDSGDGDTGFAGDVGGGLEWTAPTLVVRLTGTTTVSTEAADETRASLSVRKSTGNFDLGLNLTADSTGDIDTGRLLTGEWRF